MPRTKILSHLPTSPRSRYRGVPAILIVGITAILIALLLPDERKPPTRRTAPTSSSSNSYPIYPATTQPGDEEALADNPFVKVEIEDRRSPAGRRILVLTGDDVQRIARLFPGIGMGRQHPVFGVPRGPDFVMTFTRRDGQTLGLSILAGFWSDSAPSGPFLWPPESASMLEQLLPTSNPQ